MFQLDTEAKRTQASLIPTALVCWFLPAEPHPKFRRIGRGVSSAWGRPFCRDHDRAGNSGAAVGPECRRTSVVLSWPGAPRLALFETWEGLPGTPGCAVSKSGIPQLYHSWQAGPPSFRTDRTAITEVAPPFVIFEGWGAETLDFLRLRAHSTRMIKSISWQDGMRCFGSLGD